jgi:hypothetical protein
MLMETRSKRIEKRRKERTKEELLKEFMERPGEFDSMWAHMSLSERKTLSDAFGEMRPESPSW